MAIPLHKLIVQLQAENAQLHSKLDQTNRKLGQFQKSASAAGAAVSGVFKGLVAGFSLAAVNSAVNQTVQSLAHISDQAEKLGVTTDALQELRYAASQVGVSVGSFDVGFQRFTRRVADAASGNKALAKTFADFNISLADGNGRLKTNEQVFNDFADAIARSDDQGKRILKTFQLFDTEGVDLVRLLQRGSQAIKEFRDDAQRFGAVVDAGIIRNARESARQLDVMQQVIRANLAPALASLAPILVTLSRGFAAAAQGAAKFFDSFKDTEEQTNIALLEERLTALNERAVQLATTVAERSASGRNAAGAKKQLAAVRKEITEVIERSRYLKDLRDKSAGAGSGGDAGPLGLPKPQDIKEVKQTFAGITRDIREQNQELKARLGGWELEYEIQKKIADVAERIGRDLFPAEIDHIRKLMTESAGLTSQLEQGAKQVKETSNVARDLGLTFTSAFESAVLEGGKLRDVLKGIAKDVLAIALRKSVTEPLGASLSSFFGSVLPGAAAGSSYTTGGPMVVGELGPEVIIPPRGSQVIPNNKIGGDIIINVDARGSSDPAGIDRAVRAAVAQSIDVMRSMKIRGQLPEFG